jgi:hypothetical protein
VTLPPNPCGHRTKHTSRVGCCAGCRNLFSSDSAFERHRRGGECLEPSSVGLNPKESRTAPGETVWSLPGGYHTDNDQEVIP